jgi:predicted HicB family RNase H-like nuclease
MPRETKTARIEARIFPSLKSRAETVATRKNKSLSDWAVELIEREVKKEEKANAREAQGA